MINNSILGSCFLLIFFFFLNFESRVVIKAGHSETKEGIRVQEATGESLGSALLWFSRKAIGQK